jgi:hypothetical protein
MCFILFVELLIAIPPPNMLKRTGIQHSYDTNANRKSNAAAKSRPIRCIETKIEYPSITIAAKELGLTTGNICNVRYRKTRVSKINDVNLIYFRVVHDIPGMQVADKDGGIFQRL